MRCLFKLAIIVYIIIVTPSCVSSQITRTVDENNVFNSNALPVLRIKVSDTLKYWGTIDNLPIEDGDSYGKASGIRDLFTFRDEENCRFLVISIYRLTDPRTHFYKDIAGINNLLEAGSEDLKDGTYAYVIYTDTSDDLTSLVKVSKRISGPKNNISTLLMYSEKTEGIWVTLDSLTEDQKARLQEFKRNWEKAFEIQ